MIIFLGFFFVFFFFLLKTKWSPKIALAMTPFRKSGWSLQGGWPGGSNLGLASIVLHVMGVHIVHKCGDVE